MIHQIVSSKIARTMGMTEEEILGSRQRIEALTIS